jgi:hypothetical protein
VKKLRGNADSSAAALENEAAECLRLALQRRHANVERVRAKCHVPSGKKRLELDVVVLADGTGYWGFIVCISVPAFLIFMAKYRGG